jgi:IS5 family transposase
MKNMEINGRLEEISKLGDPLERLNEYMNWEDFRGALTTALKKEAKGLGGRPAYDYVMMFKILILQKLYNMSDDKTEYQIKDRLSFQRFLCLSINDKVPDAKTIWNFREALCKADVSESLFYGFTNQLEKKKIISRSGSIVDATFVDVPRQRNTKDENERIKNGETPEERRKEENRHKLSQKDVDARWAVKNKEVHYGYKNNVWVDKKSKIICKYSVTSAEVHDGQELKNLIEPGKDRRIYGDSAYTGWEVQSVITETMMNRIHDGAYRGKPLTAKQKRDNKNKSHIRVRVEHVFASLHHFGGIIIRSIGKIRAKVQIALMNLTYNINRYAYLMSAKS